MAKLKDFYKTFAWELVRTNSGAQAYLNAKGKTSVNQKERIRASVQASHLLKNEEVRKYLQLIRDEQRIGVTEVVSEIANIIRFDPLDMLNADGTVKAIHDMPETARKMIAGLEVNELWFGRGADREQYGVVKKIKFISKMDAIEKAMKHLGGYKEDNDQKKSITQIAIFQLPDNERDNTEKTRLIDISSNDVMIGQTIEVVENAIEIQEEPSNPLGGRGVGDNVTSAGGVYNDIEIERDPDDL